MGGMNHYFFGVQSRKHALKLVHGKVAIGGTGAPTLNAAASTGITSITRTGAGTYEVLLDGKVPQLVHFTCTLLHSSTSQLVRFQLTSDTVATDGKFVFKCLAATDATTTTLIAADPASGATLLFTVEVNNTSLDQ